MAATLVGEVQEAPLGAQQMQTCAPEWESPTRLLAQLDMLLARTRETLKGFGAAQRGDKGMCIRVIKLGEALQVGKDESAQPHCVVEPSMISETKR